MNNNIGCIHLDTATNENCLASADKGRALNAKYAMTPKVIEIGSFQSRKNFFNFFIMSEIWREDIQNSQPMSKMTAVFFECIKTFLYLCAIKITKMKALSPLFLFLALYLGVSIIAGDFYKVPVTIAFLIAGIYAVAITKGKIDDRVRVFSRGAGSENVLLMVWIYILAGAFAASAKAMGAVDATVNLTLDLLPASLIMPGIFLAACFISLAIGTSVGTVAALTPVAVGLAQESNITLPLMVAIVVGGAFFGDNLSFISDTTISATQTQGCKMNDKFKANFALVMPVALVMIIVYYCLGRDVNITQEIPEVLWWKIIPYMLVIFTAICGLNVMMVLLLGIVSTGIIGMIDGSYNVFQWMGSMGNGIVSMGDLIVMAILAAGMLEMIRHNGGIDFLIDKLTRNISGRRGAEMSIATLVGLVVICTANNTVSIITTGPIAKDIATRYSISPRRSASILDTASCCLQGLIPYSAQIITATGLAATSGALLSPLSICQYLYYPLGIGLAVLCTILFRTNR